MRNPEQLHSTNVLIDVLSRDDLKLLEPHFVREKLNREKVPKK